VYKALDSGKIPDLFMLEGIEKVDDGDAIGFITKVRSQHSFSQLPMMVCEPSENVNLAIKLMKYGVNDFYNLTFSAEELFVRLNQNIDQAASYKEIERISRTDALTGLLNRGYLFNYGQGYYENSVNEDNHIFVIMVDVDFFKKGERCSWSPKG